MSISDIVVCICGAFNICAFIFLSIKNSKLIREIGLFHTFGIEKYSLEERIEGLRFEATCLTKVISDNEYKSEIMIKALQSHLYAFSGRMAVLEEEQNRNEFWDHINGLSRRVHELENKDKECEPCTIK